MKVLPLHHPAVFRVEILDHLLNRQLVTFRHLLEDFPGRSLELRHLQARQQPDVIHHPRVTRIGRGEVEGPLAYLQRQDAAALDELRRQGTDRFRGHSNPRQINRAPRRAVPNHGRRVWWCARGKPDV